MCWCCDLIINISTHAPRVRRDPELGVNPIENEISTHAPRVRRDMTSLDNAAATIISTHAPRVRRDYFADFYSVLQCNFYSRASCEARRNGPD